MAVRRDGQMDMSVDPDAALAADETLLVLGKYKSLQKCFHI